MKYYNKIKKYALSFFITIVMANMLCAALGPKVNSQGVSTATGQNLHSWLLSMPNRYDYIFEYFARKNKELVEWEIEKSFKAGIFNMDLVGGSSHIFFDYSVPYLLYIPEKNKALIDLAWEYCRFGGNVAEGFLYLLLKNDERREKIKRFSCRSTKGIVEKYDRELTKRKFRTADELYQKAYDHLTDSNWKFSTAWSKEWDQMDIIRDIIQKSFDKKYNKEWFIKYVKESDRIKDDLAEIIIRYIKLDTPNPELPPYIYLSMLGHNSRLDKVLLEHFKRLKKPPVFDNAYYLAASMLLKRPLQKPNRRNINFKTIINAGLVYAKATGNYNRAFQIISTQHKYYAKDSYGSSASEDYYLRECLPLLSKNSDLNMQAARKIMNKMTTISSKSNFAFDAKFSILLQPEHLQTPLPFGSCFPFESLSPQNQEQLFNTYVSVISESRSHLGNVITDKMLAIKSPEYRMKAVKLLFQYYEYELSYMSLEILPELLKIIGGDDPELTVKACKLVGKTSTLGKSAAPTLRKLLQERDDFTVKIALICALAQIGDRSSIPLIKKYCEDKNRLLARAAKQAVFLLQPFNENDIYFEEMLKCKRHF